VNKSQLDRIEAKLDAVLELLRLLLNQGEDTMADLTALEAQVAASVTVEQSAITLIQGLAAQIAAAGTDPAALASLVTQLNTSAAALGAAITANTPAQAPAAPAAPVTPAPAAPAS
jgi:hypothetical protein